MTVVIPERLLMMMMIIYFWVLLILLNNNNYYYCTNRDAPTSKHFAKTLCYDISNTVILTFYLGIMYNRGHIDHWFIANQSILLR